MDITVITDYGPSSPVSGDQFTYTALSNPTVTGMNVTSGTTAGGTVVLVSGTRFTGVTAVYLGTVPALSYAIESDTQMAVTTPAEMPGIVDISVVTPTGSSPLTASDKYTFVAAPAPTVAGVSLNAGSTGGGVQVTITGSNLGGATAVYFGSILSPQIVWDTSTAILAVVPCQAAGTVDVTVVTTASATPSVTSSADHFTYNLATPTVAAVTPNNLVLPTTWVTITGSNFTGVSAVNMGSTSVPFTFVDDNTIQAEVLYGLTGTLDVTVTTAPTITSSTSSADQISVGTIAPPTITSLSTSSGYSCGGTLVTVTGTGFMTATAAYFGDVPATPLVMTDSQMVLDSPAHAAGQFDITIVNAAGASTASSASAFTFNATPQPTISSISPSGGYTSGGESITINGAYLTGATSVTFGAVTVTVPYLPGNTDSSITVYAPAQVAGTVDVRVTTAVGVSTPTTGDQYTYSNAPAPAVASLGVTMGSTGGGTTVVISGTNLQGASAVYFGSVAANFTGNFANGVLTLTATSPPQPAGTVDVTVVTPSGTSTMWSGDKFSYLSAGAPSITTVTPNTGTTAAGNTITIVGSGFTAATAVSFNGVPAQDYTVQSDSSISAVVPMESAGTVDITITTPSGTSSTASADHYTYTNYTGPVPTIAGVSPNTGYQGGGQVVTITGTGFTGATSVKFHTWTASSFTIVNDSEIVAIAPAGTAGTVYNIFVTTNNGTSTAVTADHFTFLSTGVPTITGLSPNNGTSAGGTSVAITGTNFANVSEVDVDGISTSFTVNSSTSITVPSTPADYPGAVHVQVISQSGPSTLTSSDLYTYNAASVPTISSLSPTSGTTAGGTTLTIYGNNLLGTTDVQIGGISVPSFTINSNTQLTVTTPAEPGGTADVIVYTTSGPSTPTANSLYSYNSGGTPSITGMSPTSGTDGGGTTVTISGNNLAGATSVSFGWNNFGTITADSSTSITVTTPTGSPWTYVNVVVTTPSGDSGLSPYSTYYYTDPAPTVVGLDTSGGTSAGGALVTISGTDFTGASAVDFGTVPAPSFTINSDSSITAVSPAQSAATVDVTVTNPDGTSTTSSADEFTYTAAPAPSVGGLSTTSGPVIGGTDVVVTGAYFTGASDVQFNGVSASSFTILSDSAIEASAPAGGTGTVDVQVVTPSGTSSTSSSDDYTYTAVTAPTITALSATSGSSAGGDTLTLTGTGLLDTTSVTVGGQPASFLVLSDTSLTFTTPAMTAGGYDVVVSVPGASSNPARFLYTQASAPAVSGLGTTSGSTAGGDSVTITGTNFGGAYLVTFGGVPASFTVASSTSITATSPSAAAAGTVDVIVYTSAGDSAVSSADEFSYSAASAPTLSSLSLTSGSTTGGDVVSLFGSDFTGAIGVSFGSVAADFTVQADDWITATVPAVAAAGTVNVTVTSAGGTSSAISYTSSAPSGPVVSILTQSTGTTAGGDTFVLVGSGFLAATDVEFGSTPAAAYTVLTDNAIEVTTPAASAGTVDVTVTTAGGTSTTSSADEFTFAAPSAATVTAIAPSSGPGGGGTVVIITGTNFNDVSSVAFGGIPAEEFFVNCSTQITAVAPPETAGTVDITVTTPAGTSATSSADEFTYTAPTSLTITSIGTAGGAGPTAGGSGVLITGTGLLGTSSVSFGANPALSFTVIDDNDVFATAPAGSAGTVTLTVTTPAGSATGSYTYRALPTVTSLSVSTDTASGGTPLTISGTGFTGASAVYFGDTAVTSFTVVSDTSLVVYVPAHAVGTVPVSVYAPGGESATTTFTYTTATTDTWIGGNADWGTAADWSTSSVPSTGVDAVIPSGVTVTLSAFDSSSIHQLTVAGTLDVTGGSLSMSAISTTTGTWNISGGSVTLSAASSIASLDISGGTFTVSAASAITSLTLSGGTLAGSSPTTVTGTFTWSGGTISSSSLTLAGTSSLSISGLGSLTDSGTVYNSGSATWTGGGTLQINGASWNNQGGGTFTANATSAQTISGGFGFGGSTFANAGTFSKTGTATTTFASNATFTNTGTASVGAGKLVLTTGSNSGTISVSSGTELDFAGTVTLGSGSTITGSGTVKVTGGTTTLGGTVTASTVTVNSGGTLTGVATINANVTNNGTLLEKSVYLTSGVLGILVINGNFTQGFGGALNMLIGGTTAGTGYDQLQISGTATLGGTLAVNSTSGYTIPTGQTFSLLTFGSYSGSFGTINNDSSTTLTPQYNSTSFNLLSCADAPPAEDDDVPAAPPPEEQQWAIVRATADDRPVIVLAAAEEEAPPPEPARDLVFAALAEAAAEEQDCGAVAWDDGGTWEDILTLPLRLPLALVEQLVEVV